MSGSDTRLPVLDYIVDRINVGVFVIDEDLNISLWNKFMEMHSGRSSEEVVGKNLFESFPEIPRYWMESKINNVMLLKNFSFTAWEQRPYLFRFRHNRPITGGVDYMRQNCTFLPIKNNEGKVTQVCITIFDVTDMSIYQSMLQRAMSNLEDMSSRDGLTGIFNRRYLEQTLASEFSKIKRYGGKLSLLIFDLDNFKVINDTHGHLAGDQVLRVVVERIERLVRKVDTIGRYGGEEFAIVLPGTALPAAMILAKRLLSGINAEPIVYDDNTEIQVSISIGISEMGPDMAEWTELVRQADEAMYQAKDEGRNCISSAP